ncbi:MAG: YncE family protein [Planctomycetia bacterium]|nr:YncE family protein [Planctomycetia bacterium]
MKILHSMLQATVSHGPFLIGAICVICGSLLSVEHVTGDILISANEGKYDLSSGRGTPVERPRPDSLSILDFAAFPPRVAHVEDIANSVIGPPTNVAITPDERLALVANSVRQYTSDPKRPVPDDMVQVVLLGESPRVIAKVKAGRQPSGIAFNPAGTMAIVANRADGTVTVLSIRGDEVKAEQTLEVGDPASEPSDVAITPDGTGAVVSLNKAGVLRILYLADGRARLVNRKLPVYGNPYHVEITPDGQLALSAGSGAQDGPDADALSVIDLAAQPVRTSDHIAVGTGPESFDISPDGKLVAVVLMNGSNLAADNPLRTEQGLLQILARDGRTFRKVDELPIGRIPEGVCFTPDGRHLVVQEHAAQQLALFAVSEGTVKDAGVRIKVPGFPSGLRRAGKGR